MCLYVVFSKCLSVLKKKILFGGRNCSLFFEKQQRGKMKIDLLLSGKDKADFFPGDVAVSKSTDIFEKTKSTLDC